MNCPACGLDVEVKMVGQENNQAIFASHIVNGRVCPTSWLPPPK